jgi:hypothetical protein
VNWRGSGCFCIRLFRNFPRTRGHWACTPGYIAVGVFPGACGRTRVRQILRIFRPGGWLQAIRDIRAAVLNNSARSGCNDFDDLPPQIHEFFIERIPAT